MLEGRLIWTYRLSEPAQYPAPCPGQGTEFWAEVYFFDGRRIYPLILEVWLGTAAIAHLGKAIGPRISGDAVVQLLSRTQLSRV